MSLAVLTTGSHFGDMAVAVVIIAAVVALVLIGCKAVGMTIPGWLVQVFWVVVAAFVIIAAIRAVISM